MTSLDPIEFQWTCEPPEDQEAWEEAVRKPLTEAMKMPLGKTSIPRGGTWVVKFSKLPDKEGYGADFYHAYDLDRDFFISQLAKQVEEN